MAHHQENRSLEWVKPTAYLFWIRHPRKVVESFTKVIDKMSQGMLVLFNNGSNGNNFMISMVAKL